MLVDQDVNAKTKTIVQETKMKIILLAFSLIFFMSGCVGTNPALTYKKTDIKKHGLYSQEVESIYINYIAFSDESVKNIFKKVKQLPAKIIVTDFVDMTSLNNCTKLGYVFSNNIKNSIINNYDIDVIEAEVSKYFKISDNGIKILSRDIKKLRSTSFNIKYAVVGTYTYSHNELIVFVKLINLKTGVIKGSYAKAFPMGEGTKMMLYNK